MRHRDFEKLAVRAFGRLPERFRQKVKNVALLIEDEPSRAAREESELTDDETLLGLYHGIPNTARGADYGVGPTLPDTITLFKKPIEDEAGNEDPTRVEDVIFETLWHEIAHYFGFEEDAVREREEKRDAKASPRAAKAARGRHADR